MDDNNTKSQFEEYRKIAEKWASDHQRVCPSCGHCPTCGRGGYQVVPMQPYPYYPATPYPYPVWCSTDSLVKAT